MALRRVFVDRVRDSAAVARGKLAHHLARVARIRPGERVEISDQAHAYLAVAESTSPAEVTFRVLEPLPATPPAPAFDAGLSIIRFRRFEWAMEKLTELGVRRVVPVIAARSGANLVASAPSRLRRWRRIAFEAAQQARRLSAPEVLPPQRFEDAVVRDTVSVRVLVDPSGSPVAQVCDGGPCWFLIGPEGGWTAEEQALARTSGCKSACLGRTILRSETAAVAMAAICSSRFA